MALTEVLMPLMGEGVNEATLVRWLKKPGEPVAKDEPLLEVSTDKVDTEIPSPTSGFVIEQLFKAGDTLTVNHVIARIGAEATATGGASPNTKAQATKTPPPPQAPAAPTPQRVQTTGLATGGSRPQRSSPLVRKMAQEQNIDLSQVAGSGLHGRITKRDLLGFVADEGVPVEKSLSVIAEPAQAPAKGHASYSPARLKTTIVNGVEMLEGVPVEREKMTKMRQLIAEHMIDSVRTSPHVTTVFEVDMHKVWAIREKYKKKFAEQYGFNLTFTPFLIHASVQAIKAHPIVNVSVDGDEILHKKDINIGCAVALDNGLIVPVIKRAQELSLHGVASRLNDLVTRARSKKLQPDDVKGGTFSITNPGGWGSIVSSPIINQPQVAILSIGAIVKRPVVVDDMIAIRPLMQVGLTFDHRVIDGEGGAKYLATLKNILENYNEVPM